MALISERLSRFKPSLTVKISQKAGEMSKDMGKSNKFEFR